MVQNHIRTVLRTSYNLVSKYDPVDLLYRCRGLRSDLPRATARPIPVEHPVIATTLPGSNFEIIAMLECLDR